MCKCSSSNQRTKEDKRKSFWLKIGESPTILNRLKQMGLDCALCALVLFFFIFFFFSFVVNTMMNVEKNIRKKPKRKSTKCKLSIWKMKTQFSYKLLGWAAIFFLFWNCYIFSVLLSLSIRWNGHSVLICFFLVCLCSMFFGWLILSIFLLGNQWLFMFFFSNCSLDSLVVGCNDTYYSYSHKRNQTKN